MWVCQSYDSFSGILARKKLGSVLGVAADLNMPKYMQTALYKNKRKRNQYSCRKERLCHKNNVLEKQLKDKEIVAGLEVSNLTLKRYDHINTFACYSQLM